MSDSDLEFNEIESNWNVYNGSTNNNNTNISLRDDTIRANRNSIFFSILCKWDCHINFDGPIFGTVGIDILLVETYDSYHIFITTTGFISFIHFLQLINPLKSEYIF